MNTDLIRCDEIVVLHKSDTEHNTPVRVIAPSGIGIQYPVHIKDFFIDDKFKILVESNALVIQKKIDGVFTNYFKLE